MSITAEAEISSGAEGPSARASGVEFLNALQLSDSFFPTGLYTLSHGFEAFVQAGLASKEDLEALLRDYLENVLGPADGVALSHAHRAVEGRDLGRLLEVDRRLPGGTSPGRRPARPCPGQPALARQDRGDVGVCPGLRG